MKLKEIFKGKTKNITFTFLSLIAGIILLLNFIPASTLSTSFDKISYTSNDLKVIFQEKGINKGVMELVSHNSTNEIKKVGAGWDVVMYYDIYMAQDYSNVIQDPIFIDLKTGLEVQKDYKFVKWVVEEREKEFCSEYNQITTENGTVNGENCLKISKEKYMFEGWVEYNSRDLPKNPTRIGLMVYNELGDYIDGIFNIDGHSITKHAGWITSLDTGLISWYDLDETSGTTATDSHGTNDGTINGATPTAGKIAGGFLFNRAEGDYIDLGYNLLETSYTGDSTVSAWFSRTSSTSTEGTIFSKTSSHQAHTLTELRIMTDGKLRARTYRNGASIFLYSPTPVTADTWHHASFVISSTGNYLYLNGELVASDTINLGNIYTANDNTYHPASIGALRYGNLGSTKIDFFDGKIDEVGIWSRALTSTEIETLYNSGTGLGYQEGGLISPTVETNTADGVTSSQAVLNGNLISLGDYTTADVFFQYIKTEDLN